MSEISSYINNTTNSGLLNSMYSEPTKTNFSSPYSSTSNLLSMTFDKKESSSDVMESLLNAKTEALILSSTGSKLSGVYQELTSAGFEGKEISNFVSSSQALDEGKLTDYVETASTINDLGGKDLMIDWVNKAASILNEDTKKGLEFISQTKDILNEKYVATEELSAKDVEIETIQEFMDNF